MIIGGGAIGVEIAYLISKEGVQITLVEMFDHILKNALDSDISEKVERYFIKKNIDLRLGDKIKSIKGNGQVTDAVLESGDEISAD